MCVDERVRNGDRAASLSACGCVCVVWLVSVRNSSTRVSVRDEMYALCMQVDV